jgi:hypothetical protein
MASWRGMEDRGREKFVRMYGWLCVMGVVVGVVASLYFFANGPVKVGWTLAILTVLLLPAYLLVPWRARKGF